MAHSHGGPSNKWCDIIGGELVRGERSVEQLDFRRTPAQSRAFADRSENVASPVPIAWHWKERHRPSEVSAVSAARRLGYGIQPCAGDWAIEKRGERVRVGCALTARDVTAIEWDRSVASIDDGSSWLATDIPPDHTRSIEASALRAK
jgi:hypothetical protein